MRNKLIALIGIVIFLVSCKNDSRKSIDNAIDTSKYYLEPHRPQFHFSPEANWMNDPNGMVYHDGEYHLFYQYYPDSTVWGPMHWGHAVSKDLVHWEHLPIALYPDSLGYIFSGSAVMDHNNTSGLGEGDKGPMVAIFTHHNENLLKSDRDDFQYQSLAYSNDAGRTWTKYEGNPVVPNPGIRDFRDPKVIWDEEREQWVMVFAAYDKALFYTSPNLIDWQRSGEFGLEGDTRLWECPDLFPMKVEETGEVKWVLITSIQQDAPNGGTATSYFVGDFDGQSFIGDPMDQKWLDWGTDNYALVSWSDVPEEDGRRLAIGWMSNWQYAQVVPTENWRSAMTLSRHLTLHEERDGYLVRSLPVEELSAIETSSESVSTGVIEEDMILYENHSLLKLELNFKIPEDGMIHLRFSNDQGEYVDVGYHASDSQYFIDRTFSGNGDFSDAFLDYHTGEANYEKESIEMLIYLDHASIELFADSGRCVMTDIFFPSSPYNRVELITDFNPAEILHGQITELKSIWR